MIKYLGHDQKHNRVGSMISFLGKQRMESKADDLCDKDFQTMRYDNIIWDHPILKAKITSYNSGKQNKKKAHESLLRGSKLWNILFCTR